MSRQWVQTYTGHAFYYDRVDENVYSIADIAHALSNQCRFSGHTGTFYSVAEHSVLCSYLVPVEYALEALLHDASEAYLVDLPKPLKYLLPDYCAIEDQVMRAIANVFTIQYPFHEEIKRADIAMLYAERDVLMSVPPQAWANEDTVPASVVLQCWNPVQAATKFLERYTYLMERMVFLD